MPADAPPRSPKRSSARRARHTPWLPPSALPHDLGRQAPAGISSRTSSGSRAPSSWTRFATRRGRSSRSAATRRPSRTSSASAPSSRWWSRRAARDTIGGKTTAHSLSLHQTRRGARHLAGRAVRDRVPADDDHREERAVLAAALLDHRGPVRREHRHRIAQRDPRPAHGRRAGDALRRAARGSGLLPCPHGGRGRPRRPRRPYPCPSSRRPTRLRLAAVLAMRRAITVGASALTGCSRLSLRLASRGAAGRAGAGGSPDHAARRRAAPRAAGLHPGAAAPAARMRGTGRRPPALPPGGSDTAYSRASSCLSRAARCAACAPARRW